MKRANVLCSVFAALALVLGLSGLGFAQMYGPGMYGPGMMYGGQGWGGDSGLSQDKLAAVQKLYNDHYQATYPLRQQLFAKQSELNAQLYGQKIDDKKIQALAKEIADLNGKLYADQVELRKQLAKLGVAAGGMGYGGMMNGYGGMGYGGMGYGMGGYGMGGYGMGWGMHGY